MGATLVPPNVPVGPAARLEQQRYAASQGRRVTTARKEWKQWLRDRSPRESVLEAANLIEQTPFMLRSMPVRELLRAIRRLKDSYVDVLLAAADIEQKVTLGSLDDDQRRRLGTALRLRALSARDSDASMVVTALS